MRMLILTQTDDDQQEAEGWEVYKTGSWSVELITQRKGLFELLHFTKGVMLHVKNREKLSIKILLYKM